MVGSPYTASCDDCQKETAAVFTRGPFRTRHIQEIQGPTRRPPRQLQKIFQKAGAGVLICVSCGYRTLTFATTSGRRKAPEARSIAKRPRGPIYIKEKY